MSKYKREHRWVICKNKCALMTYEGQAYFFTDKPDRSYYNLINESSLDIWTVAFRAKQDAENWLNILKDLYKNGDISQGEHGVFVDSSTEEYGDITFNENFDDTEVVKVYNYPYAPYKMNKNQYRQKRENLIKFYKEQRKMNRNLYIMVGISGAGKSTWIKAATEDLSKATYRIISPDNERRRISGDVSNQECSAEAFTSCFKKLTRFSKNLNLSNLYWDATNLNTKSLNSILKIVNNSQNKLNVHIICFEDSRDWQLCYSRVNNDISNGVDRSNTVICVSEETGLPLIQDMSNRYIHFIDEVLPDWCSRNNVDYTFVGGQNGN